MPCEPSAAFSLWQSRAHAAEHDILKHVQNSCQPPPPTKDPLALRGRPRHHAASPCRPSAANHRCAVAPKRRVGAKKHEAGGMSRDRD